nr:D-inositol-3-phosphate glycosyltransferase [Jiangella alkaliphila]
MMLSVHTSPLDQPGGGNAGGMNVYVVELARRLAGLGVEVEVFTRATSSGQPPVVETAPGVLVRHVAAGPYELLPVAEVPAQLCAFTSGVLRAEARRPPGWYDLVHSHYWLSGHVGWLATSRWGVPLVHSMHTMSKVKNLALADGESPEPRERELGEEQVVAAADLLVASTDDEAAQLAGLYGADPARVATVPPGVDLDVFAPGPAAAARARLGLPRDAVVLLFAGRIQPLKAPDVLVRAASLLLARDPALRERLVVAVVGGPSGSGLAEPHALTRLAHTLDVSDVVRFEPPVGQLALADWYRAADLTAVPSYSESFGLVALESQACGTPVVAAAVGGLRTAVAHDVSGLLVDGHDPADWADAVAGLIGDPDRLRRLGTGAVTHAAEFGWDATATRMLDVYARAMERRQVMTA